MFKTTNRLVISELTCAELHHQPEVIIALIPLIELYNVGVIQILAKTNLRGNTSKTL